MTIYNIDNPLSDDGRNKINNNFQELKTNINKAVDDISNKAFDQVVDEAKLNWKEPVNSIDQLPWNDIKGDTRMARDTGKVYRFNGTVWVEIQQIDAGPVNEVDSRLSALLAQIPQYQDIPYKIKPSVDDKLRQLLGNGQWDYFYSEDFGFPKNSFVVRTQLNLNGGTNGTAIVYAMPYVKIVGGVENIIRYRVNASSLTNFTTVTFTIATDVTDGGSSIFPTVTDLGGGLYEAKYTSTVGDDGKFIRMQFRFTPTDTTNDKTVHHEYYAVDYIERIVNGETMSTKDIDWQPHTIINSPYNISPYFGWELSDVFHYRGTNSIVGKKPKYLYVSPNGSGVFDSGISSKLDLYGFGTENRPITYEEAFKLQLCETLILFPGEYTYTNKTTFLEVIDGTRTLDYTNKRSPSVHNLICLDGKATINAELKIETSAMTLHATGIYKMPFTLNSYNSNASQIEVYSAEEGTRPYKKVTTLIECETNQGTCFHDGTSLYVHFWNNIQVTLYTTNSKNFLKHDLVNKEVFLHNIIAKGFYEPFYVRKPFFFSGVVGVGSVEEIYDIDNTDGIFVDCEARKSNNDGFNFGGYGHTEMYDCKGFDNLDDGCSHHNNCTFHMQGGEFNNNGKGGVVPAYDVKGVAIDVIARNHFGGSWRVSPTDERYGGFFSFGSPSSDYYTQFKLYRCVAENNYRGFLAADKTAVIEMYECKATNNNFGISALNGSTAFEKKTKFSGNGVNVTA